MPILEVKNICKSFGSTEVLKGISFSLEQGQVVSIIGSSGSGKTTLLRCINMLEKATKGQVLVNDEVIFDAADPATQKDREMRKKRLHFGFVFQSFNLFPQYTALKNVMLAPELAAKERPDYKQNRKEIHAQLEREARGYLEQVGLGDKVDNYPYQLTGEVLRVIRGLADQNTTMIIVTHEMAFARDVADQVIFMDGGVVVEQGDSREIINHPKEERTKQFLSRFTEQ